jgi:hypothetical protein
MAGKSTQSNIWIGKNYILLCGLLQSGHRQYKTPPWREGGQTFDRKIMYHHGHLQRARLAALERWSKSSLYERSIFGLVFAFGTLSGAFLVWRHNVLPRDAFFIVALAVSILLRRAKTFVWDWLHVVALLLGYEYVRGLVPLLKDHVYRRPMIGFDRFVFGTVPTIALLQSRLSGTTMLLSACISCTISCR